MLLSYGQLIGLMRDLRTTPVLTVYIDGAAPDPAQRVAWRQTLRNALDDARTLAESQPKETLENFERCAERLGGALDEIPSAIGAPGWVGFVTAEGVRLRGPVPVPMPTLAKWQVGAWVSPYVRALKQTHPVFIAMVDTRSAVVYRYLAGELTRLAEFHSHRHGGHADHMGDAPREQFHPGTRGETATDVAERARLSARDHMLGEVGRRMQELLADDGSALIGGAPDSARALQRAIPAGLSSRVLISADLPLASTEAQITSIAERDARTLRASRDAALVEQVLDLAASHGTGVRGAKETIDAMSSGAGRQLLITPRFLTTRAGEAEAAVEFALDHDTGIELVSGEAASMLDAKAEGIAALLRYVPTARRAAEAALSSR